MNKVDKKVNAAILIIGNEILSGRTQDVNVIFLSRWLNGEGVKVEEVRIIPDIENIIVKNINELRKKFNYVFTTGGIGPTHDDITSQSVAKAFNVGYGYNKKAYKILKNYYKVGEFNVGRKKMAKMPENSQLILNPTSGAPGFIIENVFCLPGVPSILQSMINNLKNKISGGKKILSKTINLRTVESEIATSLAMVQKDCLDVEIGSYPFFKGGKIGVAIVLRSTDNKKMVLSFKKIISFVKAKKIKLIK